MRRFIHVSSICLAVVLAVEAHASTLTLTVDNRGVLVNTSGRREIVRAVWSDSRVMAQLALDVYRLADMPSTQKGYEELRKTASDPNWPKSIEWSLRRRGDQAPVGIAGPRVVSSTRRDHEPSASSAANRDTAVPLTSLRAQLDFGFLPPGDYTLTATVGGLASSFNFDVKTGGEPEVRDAYLHDRARRTTDIAEFRRLELERYERDPSRLDALLELVDRSVEQSTLEQAGEDLDRAIAAYRSKLLTLKGDAARDISAYIRALQMARDALPDYFRHRDEWSMRRDPKTSVYSIRSRQSNRVLRVLAPTTER